MLTTSMREWQLTAVERVCFGLLILVCVATFNASRLSARQVSVRHKEGLVHGFLVLRTREGRTLADGDLIQTAHGDRVTSRLKFRFKDGSVHDETAAFSQRGSFRLLNDHLVQNGPTFEHPIEVTIDTSTGHVTVRYTEDGKEKTASEQLQLPPGLANGMTLTVMKNIPPETPETEVSMVAATPKPRLVKLKITPQGEEPFSTGDAKRTAMHYLVKLEIGGVYGLLAPIVGKQPPDTRTVFTNLAPPYLTESTADISISVQNCACHFAHLNKCKRRPIL